MRREPRRVPRATWLSTAIKGRIVARDYVVKGPIEASNWRGTNGPLAGKDVTSYYFGVEGSDATHTINRMASSDAVREGETIHAEEKGTDKAGNIKLKTVQQGGGFGGGGKGMTPEREARIERMSHAKTAAHLMELAALLGILTKEKIPDREAMMAVHSWICDKLGEDLP